MTLLGMSWRPAGEHYFIDRDEGEDDDPPYFVRCTLAQRLSGCPLCLGLLPPDGFIEAYEVACDTWDNQLIVPTRADVWCAIEDAVDSADGDAVKVTIRRLWMVRLEMNDLPEWEG